MTDANNRESQRGAGSIHSVEIPRGLRGNLQRWQKSVKVDG